MSENNDRKSQPFDPVEKPQYYNTSDIEVIDAIDAWGLDFCLGNAVKYIARHNHKHEFPEIQIQDLKKAAWYLNHKIEQLEKQLKEG